MRDMVLQMRHVTKRFPGVIALRDVNMELYRGEILGICGENGAGKSTLMKVLSGSYAAGEYEGEIVLDGQPVRFAGVHDAQSRGIEMVYQEMNMMLDASIAENLFVGNLPGKRGWVDYKRLYADTRELLERARLELDPKMTVRTLNSGQMQLLSLMRAVSKDPKILVLDEPTTALTDQEVDTLMEILASLRERGVSCLYISHKLEELYRICDRALVIRDGQTINSHDIREVEKKTLIEEMVGRKVENLYPKEEHGFGEEVLRVEHLSVPHPNIRGRNIVDDISFSLRRGEILGIGGLVGAGRSESLGAIFGQYTNGVKKQVFLDGREVSINSPKDAINLGIGFITEERKRNGIIWMLGIRENMSVANLPKLPGKFFVKREHERKSVGEQMERLRVKAPSMETAVVQLSGGNQQKVILGKWLMSKPRILFVDEPTKGIDVGTKADFYKIMSDLTMQGVSIVMVSSDMPELMSMSDRVLVLAGGKITAELRKDRGEINETAIMAAAIAE
ncbi:MAG: sugar ABC transporter ATP-binding protein [Oscillospiraceae bacterium]|nr:sugar ABC transporter ATP-binding protein [Oscillospiraceae bacterium]